MSGSIELRKVTAFVLRDGPRGKELLLFKHPFAGIQLPAGSVEVDEDVEAAALREAREETTLDDFSNVRLLGSEDDAIPDGRAALALPADVYMRPDATSASWARLPRGITVAVSRNNGDFVQVNYEEFDRIPDPQYVTGNISGWISAAAVTRIKRRYFYAMDFAGTSEDQWSVHTDKHEFRLFWAPLDDLPQIISPQNEWVRFLTP